MKRKGAYWPGMVHSGEGLGTAEPGINLAPPARALYYLRDPDLCRILVETMRVESDLNYLRIVGHTGQHRISGPYLQFFGGR
jgi:hypothetical protein